MKRRERMMAELDLEIREHLERETQDNIERGVPTKEARYVALRKFGNVMRVKEQAWEVWSVMWLERFLSDVRFSLRTLRKTPGFTVVTILTLALGIGANTAIFSIVNSVLLKPLHIPDPDRVVRFMTSYRGTSSEFAQFRFIDAWQKQTAAFEDISAHRLEVMNLTDDLNPDQIEVGRVSSEFFHLFGASVFRGRTFTPEEAKPGGPGYAVVSYEYWNQHFAHDDGVIGRTISLGGMPYQVIGILNSGFQTEQFAQLPDIWIPFPIDPSSTDDGCYCVVTGRLKPSITFEKARAQLQVATDDFSRVYPGRMGPGSRFDILPIKEAIVGDIRPSFLILSGAVSLVLLIACTNVATLFLVRGMGRRREIATRIAIGARRGRIVRQLLTEAVILSLSGGLLGLIIGFLSIRTLMASFSGGTSFFVTGAQSALGFIPRIGSGTSSVTLDWRVVVFTIGLSLATVAFWGLVPAFRASGTDPNVALKEGGARTGTDRRQNKLQSLLVGVQIAAALMVTLGAMLLVRTSMALQQVDPGFNSHNVLVTQMSLAGPQFAKTAQLDQVVREGTQELRSLPGVEAVASSCCVPLQTVWQLSFIVTSRPLNGRYHGYAGWSFVSPEYFRAFSIPVIRGRDFTDNDRAGTPRVVIINEAMVRRFWPKSDPLNDRLIIGTAVRPEYAEDGARQIIGIVGDVRDQALNRDPRPEMYVPISQLPDGPNALNLRLLPIAWIVRTAVDPNSLKNSITEHLRVATGLAFGKLRGMNDVTAGSLTRPRLNMILMAVFGGLAVLLAMMGIYGVMSYMVAQRTHDIGVRMALGAKPSDIFRLVLVQGMRIAITAVFAGIVAALGLKRFLTNLLFGVKPNDPLTFCVVISLLLTLVFLACYIPARRAMRIDPALALRHE